MHIIRHFELLPSSELSNDNDNCSQVSVQCIQYIHNIGNDIMPYAYFNYYFVCYIIIPTSTTYNRTGALAGYWQAAYIL